MIRLVDTHNHLFVDEFTKSRQALASAVELAVDAGVFQMLICAGDWRSVLRTHTVAALINAGYAAGIHPLSFNPKTYCTEHNLIRDFIDQHLATSTLSAIGEIGLDGTITDKIPMEFQEKVFSDQLKLARDFQLPVSVHVRGAADLVAKHIRRIGIAGGAVHAFNGSLEQAKIFINLGLKLGYGGACTYSGSCRIRKLLSELPKDVLVLETDCPDMPSSIRRAENPEDAHSMPRDLRMYAEVAAELRDVSVEEIAEQTTKNAFGAFPKLQTLGAVKKYREKIYRLIFLINIKNQSCDNPQQPIKRIYKVDKILVTVAGPDRAGVVYSVAEALSKLNCNFVDMSQTTVADQFSSIMIVNKPKNISKEKVHSEIVKIFEKRGFNMWVDVLDYQAGSVFHTDGEPFVVTVDGKNGKGLLLAFTRIFFEGKINIDNFRSINQESFDGIEKVLLVFEITVPFDIDRRALHKTLSDIAKEQGVSLSMQHRQIFEAIHRVSVA